MGDPTQMITRNVRIFMASFARFLNTATKGRLLPAHITLASLLGHIPAAWALYDGRPILAAGLIAAFGLLDSLDGALAREQNSASILGMLFDAVTDRMKEILTYSALALYVSRHVTDVQPWVVAAVAGTSLLVSYVKAKGEMALSKNTALNTQALNRTFSGGIARYEVRMALLILGLIATDFLPSLLHFIIAINLFTAAVRFQSIAVTLKQNDATAARPKTQSKKRKNS